MSYTLIDNYIKMIKENDSSIKECMIRLYAYIKIMNKYIDSLSSDKCAYCMLLWIKASSLNVNVTMDAIQKNCLSRICQSSRFRSQRSWLKKVGVVGCHDFLNTNLIQRNILFIRIYMFFGAGLSTQSPPPVLQ